MGTGESEESMIDGIYKVRVTKDVRRGTVTLTLRRPREAEVREEYSPNKRGPKGLKYSGYGESKTLGQWASDPRCEIGYTTLYSRLRYGWPVERALYKVDPEAEVAPEPFGK